jgi:tRNA threonylcarbamoyladenosine biosynthesis protein TsaB
MNILAIDTSSDCGSAVIQIEDEVVAEVRKDASMQYSEHLFGSIDVLFAQVDITLDDIDIFAAARGPGSFTGLRVGLATMAGFAFTKGKESFGVSTLAALAWQAGHVAPQIAAVLDARRGEVYGAMYRRDGEELVEVSAPAVLQPAEWLNGLRDSATVFCGAGVEALRSRVETNPNWEVVEVNPYLARTVASMAETKNRDPPEPLYVRRTSAEVNRLSGRVRQNAK